MKEHVLNKIHVVIERFPLTDRTNIEMPKIDRRGRSILPKQSDTHNEVVGYAKVTPLSNKYQPVTDEKCKDVAFKENTVSKRIRKKPLKCPCCVGESSLDSKNNSAKHSIISSAYDARREKTDRSNREKENKMCHDLKVILERTSIRQLCVPSNGTDEITDNKEIKNKNFNRECKVNIERANFEKLLPQSRNCAGSTLNTSEDEKLLNNKQICAVKLPIYRQKLEMEKTKKPDNLYEFDESDSDRSKRLVKGKRLVKKTRFKKLEISLYTPSQKRDIKTAKARTIGKNKVTKIKRPARKYNEIMEEVIQKVKGKINQRPNNVDKGVTEKSLEKCINKLPIPSLKMVKGFDKTSCSVNTLKNDLPETNLPTYNDSTTTRNRVSLCKVPKNIQKNKAVEQSGQRISTVDINKSILNISTDNISIRRSLSGDTTFGNDIEAVVEKNITNKVPAERSHTTQDIIDETITSTKEYTPQIGFRTKVANEQVNKVKDKIDTNKENVHSQQNIPQTNLHPSQEIVDESFDDDGSFEGNGIEHEDDSLDESFLEFGEVHHSTPLKNAPKINIISDVVLPQRNRVNKRRPTIKHKPWRFDQHVRRNPHFIILKTTALPCLKQDMILDHNQVEKMEEHFSKTPRRMETPKKSPIQKSILDYVSNPDHHNQENIPRSSLFDYDDFSPIKSSSPRRNNLRDKIKRNVLAPIQDNEANILPFTSTPTARSTVVRQPLVRDNEDEDIANYFGFDDEEPTFKRQSNNSEAKPFRIKGYAAKKQMDQVVDTEVPKENETRIEDVPVQALNESPIVNDNDDNVEVELFDDPEKAFSLTVPSKIYERKPRRKRLKSVEVDNADKHHPKKRKKDMMTKAEEAALEDWAAKFNSMCQEIEKYNLEIE